MDLRVTDRPAALPIAACCPGATRLLLALAIPAVLGGCAFDMDGFAFTNEKRVAAHVGTTEPLVGPDGRCSADLNFSPSSLAARSSGVESGITECELVALKGQPSDVLIGGSGKGEREVQLLYQEPAGKKIYMFTDNKLTRVVD